MAIDDIESPSLDWFLDPKPVRHYPYTKSPASFDEKFLILHSSGSTGMPKCINFTHRTLAALDSVHNLTLETARQPQLLSMASGPLFNPFPMFHASGLIINLAFSIFYDHKLILPGPGQLKVETLTDAIRHVHIDVLLAPPSLLEDLSLDPEALSILDKVKDVAYGGGPISDERVSILAKHAHLIPLIASTEVGMYPMMAHGSEDYNWFSFPPELKGIEFRKTVSDLYEMFFVRDTETDNYHATWVNFSDLQEYSTKDLFIKHPKKAGLWKHAGRIDDVLVLSNGEKVVAPPLENILIGAPEVQGALIFGQGQNEIGALLELSVLASSLTPNDIFQRLEAYIVKGNKIMPKFANLSSDRLVFIKPEKPMLRAGKGSIIRSRTIDLYEDEITELYQEAGLGGHQIFPLLKTDASSTTQSLIKIYSQIMDLESITEDMDVFHNGFDSLGVLKAVRMIKGSLQAELKDSKTSDRITPSLLYSHPTIRSLTQALRQLDDRSNDSEIQSDGVDSIEMILQRNIQKIPDRILKRPNPVSSGVCVVLTGSTGSLGSYILDTLISFGQVSKIYALNRSQDGITRQHSANQLRGLSIDFSKVTFLRTDLSHAKLGLAEKDYEMIKESAHLIIHNQWQVDFNLTLSSFEPHIDGVSNLIDLSINSPLQPIIFFTSSIGAAGSYLKVHPDESDIPETIFEDHSVPSPIGYAQSKYIAERLLDAASKKTGIPTIVARIGQIAGPVLKPHGAWNKQEWFPSLAIASAHLKMIPSDLGPVSMVDWLPVDILADILLELANANLNRISIKRSNGSIVYNVSNTKIVLWSELIPTMLRYMPEGTQTVSMSDWIKALQAATVKFSPINVDLSAIKLMDFYESLCQDGEPGVMGRMKIQNSFESTRMQQMEPIRSEWLESWLENWELPRTS